MQSILHVDRRCSRESLGLGRGTLIAKTDIKKVYRMVPVHSADHWLLGVRWDGKVFVHKTLPFGLRSAQLISLAVADALAWIMQQRGVSFADHYTDDFVTLGTPVLDQCTTNLNYDRCVRKHKHPDRTRQNRRPQHYPYISGN